MGKLVLLRVEDVFSRLTAVLGDTIIDQYTVSLSHTQKLLTHRMTRITNSKHKSESGCFLVKIQVKWIYKGYLSCIHVKRKVIEALD